MVLDHAASPCQLRAAGKRAREHTERCAVVAAEQQQVLAARAFGLSEELQSCAVLAADAGEIGGEGDGRGLTEMSPDPDGALATARLVVDTGDEVPRQR